MNHHQSVVSEISTDGQLINISPLELRDLLGGGNIRRNRKKFDELFKSIQENGIIQPVLARPVNGGYELVAGYGRRDAAIKAELLNVPALVREMDDETALILHLKENSDREDISIVDEVEHSRRFISFYNGDRKSAALKLGWSVSKLSERLELIHAAPEVLDALDAGLIMAGHALILSGFESVVQVNTLKKLIDEKWTVSELRQRASRFQISLSLAKFDQADCHSCVHNTQRQSGLFGFSEQAECSKPSCFTSKTKAHLEQVKLDAEERFGTVLWLSESLPADRSTVTPILVGKEQYSTGCVGCEKLVAVLDDSASANTGSITENQCIDRACLVDCSTRFSKFKEEQAKPVNDTESTEIAADSKTDKLPSENAGKVSKVASPPKCTNKTPQVAIDAHSREIKDFSATLLQGNSHYAMALQVIGMAQLVGFPISGSLQKTMAKLMSLSELQLNQFIEKIAAYSLTKTTSFGSQQVLASSFLAAAAVATYNGDKELIKMWKPTTETLVKYVTTGVIQIATLSGFDVHFDTKHGDGSFKKLSSAKKSDLIKGIIDDVDFDWSSFAPPSYLELINQAEREQPEIAA